MRIFKTRLSQASDFGKIRRTSDSFEKSSVISRKIFQFSRMATEPFLPKPPANRAIRPIYP
ncbi:hypothetical protein COO20_21735 [Thalassospira marina]|uniref:Uncharacterized protein n=1 Tax=Thalassospira marina TaxID=2048283 RepID=A0A2N3KGN9_9PROT|nr:hypothetical protein COO20_21735 [Thalassospira marina]